MKALEAYLYREWELEVWRSYEAKVLQVIAGSLGTKKLPTYEELIAEDTKPAMTAEEVAAQRKRLLDELNAG